MTEPQRQDALIAAIDRVKVAKHGMDAARAILALAQRGYDATASEYATAAAELRDATAVFLGRPI